ncbi:MAG: T9SS type A sorting domain-containing protein, partial [Crocinitomicaceae bacterium]|nr:T9SS type A sorting domain-containing protein [Crocinitomicaceae bacterium]
MTASDLSDLTAYLNGEHVQLDVNTERSLSAEKLNVSVYPNPVNSMLNVLTSEDAQVELSDMSGRVVLSVANVLAGEKIEMDVKTLSNGVYMLKVWNGGFISTSKVVVKH